jgi:hypothetical protein
MVEIIGGSYKEVKDSYPKEHSYEAHHIYAFSAYRDVLDIDKASGPSIRMDKADHYETASWDHNDGAREYRDEQKDLLKQGDFREAWMNDMKDIQSKFEDKYDTHLAYAERHLLELDKDKKIQLEDKFKDELGERQKTLEAIEKNQKEQAVFEKQDVLEKQDLEKQDQLKQEAEKLKVELREQYDNSAKEKADIEVQKDSKSDYETQSAPEKSASVATPTKDAFSYDEFEKDEFDSFS